MPANIGEFYDLRGRLSSEEINDFARDSKQTALNATAANALIPIVYGTAPVEGLISAYGVASPTELYIRVIWCMGEVRSINKVFINGVDIEGNSDIRYNHYRGTDFQNVDNWMDDVILAYDDDLILNKPAGDIGVCYSTFRIQASALGSSPKFQAIIDGKIVNDPRNTDGQNCTDGDPFYDSVSFACTFDAASPNTSATDDSQFGHTINFFGDAYVSGAGELVLDGNGDYLTVPYHTSIDFGSGRWCLEIVCTPGTTAAGTDYLFCRGNDSAGSRSMLIYRDGADLVVKISSDGTNWDVFNKTTTNFFVASTEVYLCIECFGDQIYQYKNGNASKTDWTLPGPAYDNNQNWFIGARSGATSSSWNGKINAVRYTKGHIRYGSKFISSAAPFADSDTFVTGNTFSDNPALCFAELASNPYYGLAATVTGTDDAADWCDETVSSNKRARMSLVLRKAKKTWQWLDNIVSYGDCLWYNDGSGVRIIPDKPVGSDNPSGRIVNDNPNFDLDASSSPRDVADWTYSGGWDWWDLGDGTGFMSFLGASPEADAIFQQTLTGLEAGTEYTFFLRAAVLAAGTIRATIDDETLITTQSTAGDYYGTFTATTASPAPVLKVIASGDASVWVSIAQVNRKYWLNDIFLRDTLSLEGLTSNDTPTRVNVRYREDATDSPSWEEKAASYQLPGVSEGDVPLIESSVNMPGIYREEEALIKAEARCLRLQNRVRVTWTTTDVGIVYRRGTVVQVRSTNRGVDVLVLVESVTMVDYGRFKVTGLRYDTSHYPTELPTGSGIIPVGAITLLATGSTAPTGWQLWSNANGKFIKGWSETTSPHEVPADTGGSWSHAGVSDDTSENGGHIGSDNTAFNIISATPTTAGSYNYITPDDSSHGAHDHTFSTGTIWPNPLRRSNILIQKITDTATTFPAAAAVFGLAGLTIQNLVRDTTYKKRLLYAAVANSNDGLSVKQQALTTGSTDDTHDHHTLNNTNRQSAIDFTNAWSTPTTGGSAHTHDVTLEITRNVKRYRLALYTATDDFTVDTGVIIMWAGAKDQSPHLNSSNWFICDGTNGTPDLRDRFIEIATASNAETTAGDNTFDYSGTTDSKSHSHDINQTSGNLEVREVYHENEVSHDHTISGSEDWTPPYYVLYFFMYKETTA